MPVPPYQTGRPPSLPPAADRTAFGALLRDRREAAGLSRAELCKRCKLSEATLKNIESARRAPSRGSLLRLLKVEALGLTWDDATGLGGEAPRIPPVPAPTHSGAARLNCLAAPGCAPLHVQSELRRFLQGAGGHIEQWAAYHDPASALAYVLTCNQGASAVLRGVYPIDKLAELVLRSAGSVPLRLVALGSGEGALELRLARRLQSATGARDLEVCLIDQSAPLLFAALDAAADAFSVLPVSCWGLLTRFARLPELTPAYAESTNPARRRVFLLLGETLADVEEERRFFRHHLQGSQPGDLLVVDFLHASSPAERDPLLTAGLTELQQAWLLGVGRRHWPERLRFELALALDRHAALPGGYAVTVQARAFVNKAPYREFSLYRFKRYEPQAVLDTVRSSGWEHVKMISVDVSGYRGSVLLCRKVAEP